jgi:hypothetical protein
VKKSIYRLIVTIVCVFLSSSLSASKPKYIDAIKSGGGQNGYDKVVQEWTGDESGLLKCTNPGNIACRWMDLGGSSINIYNYLSLVLTHYENGGSASGTMTVGSTTFNFWVLESYGDGDGRVLFYFPSGTD